ncbi:MAG: hypothetical protein Rubg2KO_30500 [Rubricoccaceae bacterium]
MLARPDRLASSRTRARARLRALQSAATLGGVSLALLAPGAQAAPVASPKTPTASPTPDRTAPARRSMELPRPVRRLDARTVANSPTFSSATTLTGLTDIGRFSHPSVADLDGDGDLDVLAGERYGTFRSFSNTAVGAGNTPTFEFPSVNSFGLAGVGYSSAPSVADLDGDGDFDVLAGELFGTFRYFENTAGAGAIPTFASATTNPFGLADIGIASAPSVADFDGDGDFDVLAGERYGTFRYFENTAGAGATPVFASAVTNPFGLADVGDDSTPSVADLDGDGDLDVLAGANDGTFRYFENTAGAGATPTFSSAVTNPFGLADVGDLSTPSVGDLDGDGDLDVLAGANDGTFRYFENTAVDTPVALAAAVTNPFGLADVGNWSAPSVADVDGDGDLDMLAGEFGGSFWYFENTAGAGTTPAFASAVTNPFGLADVGDWSTPSVADLDGDGDLDVLAATLDGDFFYFENTAGVSTTPAFASAMLNPFGLGYIGFNSTLSVVDLDGDGDLDVLAGEVDGDFHYFENTAGAGTTPTFFSAVTNPFGLADVGRASAPSVADLDSDGDLDVLAGEDGGSFFYFENTAGAGATPTFTVAQTNPFGLVGIGGSSTPSVADLDGDGDPDVLTGEEAGTFIYFKNTANPGVRTAQVTGTEGWRMLAAPSAGAPLADVLGDAIWTQGVPGANVSVGTPSVYTYDESATGDLDAGYATPASLDQPLGLGRGAFVYVYADADPATAGIQSPFPKTLRAAGTPPLNEFEWGSGGDAPLSYTDTPAPAADDGWNLLGNPFGSWFDWDAVELANVNAPVYVYDDATSAYRTRSSGIGSLAGGVIGPFQGFWVQANAASPSVRAVPTTSNGGPLLREGSAKPVVIGLRLRPSAEGATLESEAFVAFGIEGASRQLDGLDARALTPPSDAYVLVASQSEASKDASPVSLAIDMRPVPNTEQTIELAVASVASPTDLVLDWPELDLPDGWTVRLIDRERGTEAELVAGERYAFTLASSQRTASDSTRLAHPRVSGDALATGRFALRVTPAGVSVGTEDAITEASVSLLAPNPSRSRSIVRVAVPSAERVQMVVYDALGREVLLAHDGEVTGRVELAVDASALAAGVYVVRVEGESFAATRRLTVVR